MYAITLVLSLLRQKYRVDIITAWNRMCVDRKIPCSASFSLPETLGNAMQIRAWSLCGLPFDNFSVENAIIVTNARRYPLMIDPQGMCSGPVVETTVISFTSSSFHLLTNIAIMSASFLLHTTPSVMRFACSVYNSSTVCNYFVVNILSQKTVVNGRRWLKL